MITLTEDTFIGRGSHRACHIHPENPNRCIKIGEINSKESLRERKCYRLLQKRDISWDALSRFYGLVDTNLGTGAVFDLIRDYDGKISKNLDYYLEKYSENTEENRLQRDSLYGEITHSIKQLKVDLLANKILVRSLLGENILFKKISENQGRLVIIDNIGNSDFLPICDFVGFFAKKKIQRKWKNFENLLMAHHKELFTDKKSV